MTKSMFFVFSNQLKLPTRHNNNNNVFCFSQLSLLTSKFSYPFSIEISGNPSFSNSFFSSYLQKENKMGEIDTKPIESVQVALSLFEEKSEQRKNWRGSSSSICDEMDKEKDIEGLKKDLANYKVQLEAKDAAYFQLLHQLEHYQKTAEELSAQLKNSEVERDVYLEECKEARFQIDEVEAKVKEMSDQILETGKIRKQFSHVLGELKGVQGELLIMETELADARDEKLKALTQAEVMETAANMEKQRAEELLQHVFKLNEAIFMSKQVVLEAEKEKVGEVDLPTLQIGGQDLGKLIETTQELENQLRDKSLFITSLQVELNQANELLSSSDKVVSDVINDLNKLKSDLKDKEKENSDQAICIGELETEMNKLKLELKNANDEVTRLNCEIEIITDDLKKVKTEIEESKERENEAQIEIALLKAELHKERSKLAAAEAAEVRNGSVKSGLYLAVQQLKQESDGKPFQENESIVESNNNITISQEEYESLIKKAEKANQTANRYEVEILKKELEIATAKVAEFRTRTEQAVTRAEAAERAKLALEDQLRKWRERKQRRRAALAALREESLSREFSSSSYDNTPVNYQPLGKVLNMKF